MAETESHESPQPHATPGWMAQREAELQAGREKVRENMAASHLARAQADRLIRDADAQIEEDMQRREQILDTSVAVDQREHDQAGAEVIDQAQTMLEAVQHLADRQEPILDFRRANRVDRLEDPTADPKAARDLAVDHVTAQAVNQPTVLASERGVETENRPLNDTDGMFPDAELALPVLPTPKDKHVPKTRPQAEEIADLKVPEAERVVKEAAIVSDQALHRNEAIDIVRETPDVALSIDGTPETDPRSTTAESAFETLPDARDEATKARAAQSPDKVRSRRKA